MESEQRSQQLNFGGVTVHIDNRAHFNRDGSVYPHAPRATGWSTLVTAVRITFAIFKLILAPLYGFILGIFWYAVIKAILGRKSQ